jgi:hypothetical protein
MLSRTHRMTVTMSSLELRRLTRDEQPERSAVQTPYLPLDGKRGLILGVANENSIAWGCAQQAHRQGERQIILVVCP